MNKRDYFLLAIKENCHLHKQWILEAFSLVDKLSPDRKVDFPLRLMRDEKGDYYYLPIQGSWELLDDADPHQAPFDFHESLDLKIGDLANVDRDVRTTYGNALFNAIVLIYPFGGKISYMEGRIEISKIEAIILERLVDNDKAVNVSDITVAEYLLFGQAMYSLAGLTQLCVPSATPKTMTADPEMVTLRNHLLEENKDHLTDPVVVANIDAQLVAKDRAWMKGDPGEGFYIKPKSYTIVRKRLYGMLGGEDAFGDGSTVNLIEASLNDGWDINKLPSMASSLREGSFNRGHQTELGGAIAKEINRFCTNFAITDKDCGTKIGLATLVTDENKKGYINKYAFIGGKEVKIDAPLIESFVGQKLEIRSPIYCHTVGIDYCVHCSGENLAEAPYAIGSAIADIGTGFLQDSLRAAHGVALITAHWDLAMRIS